MKRRTLVIAVLAATTACSSANREVAVRSVNPQPGVTAQDALARGDILFARGEHALALDAYRRAMRNDPADPHALNGVAISYAAMGRHDLAREYFELALARAPQDVRIHRNFARSLMAQGLRGEADALLAELGGSSAGGAKGRARPTLAQLATGRMNAPAVAPQRVAAVGLERMSMGEVRLRTVADAARPALPGRMTPGLTTAIVTVGEAGASSPAIALTRELKAPIAMLQPAPTRVAAAVPSAPLAAASVKAKDALSLSLESAGDCAAPRDGQGGRSPATGYSIDLSAFRTGSAQPAGKCANMAGGDPDGRFERLWKWSGRRG